VKILNTPENLQQPTYLYPPHQEGPLIEEAFGQYAQENAGKIQADWTYLPIYWTNNYCKQRKDRGRADLQYVEAAQKFVDENLRDDEYYFTIVQCDDGIYEDLPDNVFVFGAGGIGDEPIPLLCDPHRRPLSDPDRIFAISFMGQIECGGPVPNSPNKGSSWNADGAGAKVRRKMMECLNHQPFAKIIPISGNTKLFRDLLLNTRFALAPRGYGKTSFRLYEAIGLGCVPWYIYDDPWLPYEDKLFWDQLAIRTHVSDLHHHTYQGFMLGRGCDDNFFRVCQAYLDEVYEDYFTIRGCCRQIHRMVEEFSS
jgi:hypothetical protein